MKKGKGLISIEDSRRTQFSKDYQPTGKAKSEGKAKKRLLSELANKLMSGEGLDNSRITAESIGIDLSDESFCIEVAMTLEIIHKAIQTADTSAYIAAMNQMRGKPRQIKKVG